MRVPATRRRRWVTSAAAGAIAVTATAAALAIQTPSNASTTLKGHADARGFDIGFALDPGRLTETQYRSIADTEFNYVVAENAMKWDTTERTRNTFNFGPGDQVANYAASSGKGLYGHTLVWHSQLPGWVTAISSGTDLLAAMRNHVTRVAAHYRGKVEAWDVVNEAFEDNGTRRNSIFQQRIGNSYIEEAFRAARAADPTAKLCINDYNTDGVNAKSTAIYTLVQDFKARGVPIDCVGFQAHLIVGQVPGTMQQNLQRFAALGVDVRITELDIRMPTPASAANLQTQAQNYRSVFQACLNVSRCQGVTIWGITDRYSWVPGVFPGQGSALVWDDSYNRKPAYTAVHDVLAGTTSAPTTRATTPPTTRPTTPPTTRPTTPPTTRPTTPPTTRPTMPVTTGNGGGGACTATYAQTGQWQGGFQGSVTVRAGGGGVNGWSVTMAFPNGQTINQAWNSVIANPGPNAVLRNAGYNGSLAANATTTAGFIGAWSGTNGAPTLTCSSP